MAFGHFLKDLRESRGYEQQALAMLLKVSPSLISSYEAGSMMPSERFVKTLIERLKLDEATQAKIEKLIKTDRVAFGKKSAGNLFEFGGIFKDILERYNIKAEIKIPQSKTAIAYWALSRKLPGHDTLSANLLPELRRLGVSDIDLDRLRIAHAKDSLAKILDLSYLDESEKKQLSNCITECLNKKNKEKIEVTEKKNTTTQTDKKSRRGHNEGSIYKRSDGRWCSSITVGYEGGKLKRKTYYGATRKEVADKLTTGLRNQQLGVQPVNETLTVSAFLDEWLGDVKTSVRDSTYESYALLVNHHIKPEIGRTRLARLTAQTVQRMVKNLLAKDQFIRPTKTKKREENQEVEAKKLSGRTVSYCLTVLRMALKRAMAFGLVAQNVAVLVSPPKFEQFEVQPFTVEVAQKFLKLLEGDRLEALFRVGLALGCRRGEVLALKWAGTDLENATLSISGSLQRRNHQLVIVPVKTKKSNRIMSIPKTLLEVLRQHRTRQLQERLQAGADWQNNDLVFCTSLGTPIEPRNVRRKLDSLMKDSGMPYLRLHDLRHAFASLCISQGIELKVISELLGHNSLKITSDTYTHLIPQVKTEALDLLDSVLSGRK